MTDPANIERILHAGFNLFSVLTNSHKTINDRIDAIYDQCDPEVLKDTIQRFCDAVAGSEDQRIGKIFLPMLHSYQLTLWFTQGD